MSKKVVVAGHICIDITPTIPEQTSQTIQDILSPGKLLNVGGADIHTGGAVANAGLAMKILGADVKLAGKIGNDYFGDMVISIAKQYHAEDGLIKRAGESTSYSVVLAVPGIDRIFLHHPGANDTFCADDLLNDLLEDAALFHFGYPPLMKKMYENEGSELKKVLRKVHDAGATVSLDLAAVDPNSEAGYADWKKILSEVLPYTDIFVPSAEELLFMLDREKYERIKTKSAGRDFCEMLSPEKEIVPLAEKCLEYGAKVVLIKCGAPGMYLKTVTQEKLESIPEKLGIDTGLWADLSIFEKSYVPEKVLSGTGAGDTSIAAFLTAMLNGDSPGDCLHLAAAEGACCVAAYDALSGLKPLPELRDKIKAGWKKTDYNG